MFPLHKRGCEFFAQGVQKNCTSICAVETRCHNAFWGGVISKFLAIVGANRKLSRPITTPLEQW